MFVLKTQEQTGEEIDGHTSVICNYCFQPICPVWNVQFMCAGQQLGLQLLCSFWGQNKYDFMTTNLDKYDLKLDKHLERSVFSDIKDWIIDMFATLHPRRMRMVHILCSDD